MWRIDDPQGNESAKIKYDIVPYTRGKGLDIGCGPFKTYPHFIGVDNLHHNHEFGWDGKPDIVTNADDLTLFATESMDFVFSSHTLEHMVDPRETLKEWFRVIKIGGYLVLYLPSDKLYPKVGEPGANPDHKVNLNQQSVIEWMKPLGSWDLVENQLRDADNGPGEYGNEYSFYMVFKKLPLDAKGLTVHKKSWTTERPKKTACVVRYGGFGDMIQASSVFPALKAQGYHVTMMTTPQGKDIVFNDPHIDEFILQDKDQVPNAELGNFWHVWGKKFDKFINLSESVETTLLAMPGSALTRFPIEVRRKMLDVNYLEMTHMIAEVPLPPRSKFYPTDMEKAWANRERRAMGSQPVILWSLAGSSVHKTWPWLDQILARIMMLTDAKVVLVGDTLCQVLETGWENESRVIRRSGVWSIRETLTFATEEADLVIGPETGILNAVGLENVFKIITLSHSSPENLTKHWRNCIVLLPPNTVDCYPCHQMHYSFATCRQDAETGCAQCQAQISPELMWQAVQDWWKGMEVTGGNKQLV